jgi:hypothetical protein
LLNLNYTICLFGVLKRRVTDDKTPSKKTPSLFGISISLITALIGLAAGLVRSVGLDRALVHLEGLFSGFLKLRWPLEVYAKLEMAAVWTFLTVLLIFVLYNASLFFRTVLKRWGNGEPLQKAIGDDLVFLLGILTLMALCLGAPILVIAACCSLVGSNV